MPPPPPPPPDLVIKIVRGFTDGRLKLKHNVNGKDRLAYQVITGPETVVKWKSKKKNDPAKQVVIHEILPKNPDPPEPGEPAEPADPIVFQEGPIKISTDPDPSVFRAKLIYIAPTGDFKEAEYYIKWYFVGEDPVTDLKIYDPIMSIKPTLPPGGTFLKFLSPVLSLIAVTFGSIILCKMVGVKKNMKELKKDIKELKQT